MRPASQEGQTQTCPHGGLPLSSVFHGGVRQNMFSPKGRMFQREREEKGDELLCSQIHKSDCISLPCEQPLEKSDLMPCGPSLLTEYSCVPLRRMFVIILSPPWEIRIISLFQDSCLDHIHKVPFAV
nr:uncharacterized protein LOC106838971 isoform X11 [Equus asinus]